MTTINPTGKPPGRTTTRPALDQPQPTRPVSWAAVTAGAVLTLLGGAWLADVVNVVELEAALVLPLLVTFVGLVLVGASFFGSHPGLIVLATLLSIATVFAALVPSESIRGGMGEREFTVSTVDDLELDYELAVGDMALDFGQLQLTDKRQVEVLLGAGNLDVTLPADIPVHVTVETGAGEIELLGERIDGLAVDHEFRSEGYDDADARLELKIEVGAGSIEVNK